MNKCHFLSCFHFKNWPDFLVLLWTTPCTAWCERCVCFVLQSCRGGDGDRRLEVHGGLSSSPGGRSLPIPGVCPVPLPGTSTQAPQAILTALKHIHQSPLAHTPIRTHIHNWTRAIQNPPSLRKNDRDDFPPFAVTYYYLEPGPVPLHGPPRPAVLGAPRWRRKGRCNNGAGGLIKWMFVVYNESPQLPPILFLIIQRCEVGLLLSFPHGGKSLLVPTWASVWQEQPVT